MTAFNKNFLFLDNPRSGAEAYLAEMKSAGFEGMFCNVHSYAPEEWSLIRQRAERQGMFCGPWARIDPEGKDFDVIVLDTLVRIADDWDAAPFIINAEKELDNTGATYTQIIADEVGTRDAAISMEAWLFSAVDWTPVAHLPILLQIFPIESDPAKDPAACKQHAQACGIDCAYFTFGTYGGMNPADFTLKAPYSLFTADACGGVFAPWSPTSTGFIACKSQEELLQSIVDAWNHLYLSGYGKNWRSNHTAEWVKVRAYWRGETSTPPVLKTAFGQALVDIANARMQAEKLGV